MSGGHVIKQGMQVLGADGGMIGTVDEAQGDRIRLQKAPSGGLAHLVPMSWVSRVDTHVHLDRSAAAARERWFTEGERAAPAAAPAPASAAAAPAARRESFAWLWWSLAALVLIGLLYVLLRNYEESSSGSASDHEPANARPLESASPAGPELRGLALEVQAYMDSRASAPRTFSFENVHFATESAAIPADGEGEIEEVAAVLATYPDARLRVVGYADARGEADENEDLGMARAAAIADALARGGVEAVRIETGSGGEADPDDSNATDLGRAENRRTELVVVSR